MLPFAQVFSDSDLQALIENSSRIFERHTDEHTSRS